MAVTPDATQAAIVGAIASVLTIGLSKWLDASSADRREAATERRAADRDAKNECERLREMVNMLMADNSGLRATLAARNITPPPSNMYLTDGREKHE